MQGNYLVHKIGAISLSYRSFVTEMTSVTILQLPECIPASYVEANKAYEEISSVKIISRT